MKTLPHFFLLGAASTALGFGSGLVAGTGLELGFALAVGLVGVVGFVLSGFVLLATLGVAVGASVGAGFNCAAG